MLLVPVKLKSSTGTPLRRAKTLPCSLWVSPATPAGKSLLMSISPTVTASPNSNSNISKLVYRSISSSCVGPMIPTKGSQGLPLVSRVTERFARNPGFATPNALISKLRPLNMPDTLETPESQVEVVAGRQPGSRDGRLMFILSALAGRAHGDQEQNRENWENPSTKSHTLFGHNHNFTPPFLISGAKERIWKRHCFQLVMANGWVHSPCRVQCIS